MDSKQSIRQKIRHQRQQLSPQAQRLAGKQLSRQLLALPEIAKAKHIAIYWPNDGEISPQTFGHECKLNGKKLYFPSILQNGHLHFRAFNGSRALQNNCYGIPEPVNSHYIQANKLDIVLMPLVAFDKYGTRLGMGGGYYDRTFAFKKKLLWRKKPLLIGLAHNFQEVSELKSDEWDIPLTAVATNRKVIRFTV